MLDYPNLNGVWLNDKDPGIASVWTAVAQHPGRLIELIERFTPSIDAFDSFKDELLTVTSVPAKTEALVNVGFKKLALHQMSFSGLGTKSGGPLRRKSNWPRQRLTPAGRPIDFPDDRRVPPPIRRRERHRLHLSRFRRADRRRDLRFLIYCDPPYVVQGNNLYHAASPSRITCDSQSACQDAAPVGLSYDDGPLVRDLYWSAQIVDLAVGYSVAACGALLNCG